MSKSELARFFIGISSIRIVPRLTNTFNPFNIEKDLDGPETYIENDTRFVNDAYAYIQQINKALREPVFKGEQRDTLKIFKRFVDPLNSSLIRIFGEDKDTTIQIAEFDDYIFTHFINMDFHSPLVRLIKYIPWGSVSKRHERAFMPS